MPAAAWEQIQEQYPGLDKIDILIGLPTFNLAATIETVLSAILEGLDRWFPQASVIIVAADGGSKDGTPELIKRSIGNRRPVAVIPAIANGMVANPFAINRLSYSGMPAREESFRSLFMIAEQSRARTCICIDGGIRSVMPDWVELLAKPVLEKDADYVAPVFRRQRYEGSLTNGLVAPLTRALYGKRIAGQAGGAYGFSGKLISRCVQKDLWEGEAARFSIDTWLTTVAIAEGFNVWQASLGSKIQDVKANGLDVSMVLTQAVGAVFHYMERYQDVWEKQAESSAVPVSGPPFEVRAEAVTINTERMVQGFQQGLRDLLPIWEIILAPDTLEGILALGLAEEDAFTFPLPLWVQTVYDFAIAYREKVIHRDHLLKSLTPLYLGRTASLVLETRGAGTEEVERAVEHGCTTFERMKPYLVERWRFQ
ncbi:Glycosyl transferase, family 2 [Nitrospira sp. KM1]|uniref:glycosyltransferase family A protein n=1 Tax=Nitrospira sp. KM1 TaxID=1936990 RepID=UPI0013A7A4F8|nr:glycosyltransferase family A protein [Nitrospira sp. KM1]BCA55608.1 Glycosyl transferase, family 2 [Nitrospira sp. KM1]